MWDFRFSATRMHSASHPRHGYHLSGEVGYGQDGRIRIGDFTTAGTGRRTGMEALECLLSAICTDRWFPFSGSMPRDVSHSRIGVPD